MFSIAKLTSIHLRGKRILGASHKARMLSLSALLLVACALGVASVAPSVPDASDLPSHVLTEVLVLPKLSEQVASLVQHGQYYVNEERVRSGDTLATLMMRLGVSDEAALNFIKTDDTARTVLHLRAGKSVRAQVSESGELQWMQATLTDGRDNPVKNLVIRRQGQGFQASEASAALEKRIEMRFGAIHSSLFAATDSAQIPDNVATQIVDIFSTNIDFATDLRRGDWFNVVYETLWQNGEFVRAGRVLAAEFFNAGTRYQSVWFDELNSKQEGGYYSFDGKSLKKAFLKSPLEFSRISSGFSMRLHPISGRWKQHKGVDFAAATGTPIRAAADGVIEFAGSQGGYGNLVVIKHWDKYSTAYAHMSRFASIAHKGGRVRQGDVIGYVGTTGWSTGPHLHYEFRINNQPRDPLAVDLPNAQPLAGAELQRFRGVVSDMAHRFALLAPGSADIKLASGLSR